MRSLIFLYSFKVVNKVEDQVKFIEMKPDEEEKEMLIIIKDNMTKR